MIYSLTRVAFVAVGQVAKPSDYINLAETFAASLDFMEVSSTPTGETGKVAFETAIFLEVEKALEFLLQGDRPKRRLVFMSVSAMLEAERVAKRYLDISVFVLAGDRPERGKAHICYKHWITGGDTLKAVLS